MLLNPGDLVLACVLRWNGITQGLSALEIDSFDIYTTVRVLAFAFVILAGRGEIHLATPCSSSGSGTSLAPRRIKHPREGWKRANWYNNLARAFLGYPPFGVPCCEVERTRTSLEILVALEASYVWRRRG